MSETLTAIRWFVYLLSFPVLMLLGIWKLIELIDALAN